MRIWRSGCRDFEGAVPIFALMTIEPSMEQTPRRVFIIGIRPGTKSIIQILPFRQVDVIFMAR